MVLYAQLDTREKVNIVWFKRDLRLTDHEPLRVALKDGLPLLMVYIFEPSLLNAPYSDNRHWRFVSESLDDINNRLLPYHSKIHVFYGEVKDVFSALLQYYDIKNVYSHQETGTWLTFQRDIQIKKFFKDVGIKWKEFQNNEVIRGLQNRENWEARSCRHRCKILLWKE
jgi:deoxyribodipyrimidine photo-lyase